MSTPEEIAREAANTILTGLDCSEREHEQATALILSAAAKMVRESGAVEALENYGQLDARRADLLQYRGILALNQLRAIGEEKP